MYTAEPADACCMYASKPLCKQSDGQTETELEIETERQADRLTYVHGYIRFYTHTYIPTCMPLTSLPNLSNYGSRLSL